MDLAGIQLTNFFSHQNTNISLSGGLVGVFGANGAGKSSMIADSVTWSLWGKSRVGGAGDEIISKGKTYCEATATFRVNEKLWKVTRTRIRDSKTQLEFAEWQQDRWNDISGPTLKDTQGLINKTLGMTYEIFRNSSCIEQGQANSFSQLAPSEAANVILEILQLNKYKQYRKIVSEKVLRLEQTATEVATKIRVIKDQLETYNGSTKIYTDKLSKREIVQSHYATFIKIVAEADTRSQEILEQLSSCDAISKTYQASFLSLSTQLEKYESQLKVIENEIAGHCPLCKTELTEKSFLGIQDTLKDNIANVKEEQKKLHSASYEHSQKIAGYEQQLRLLRLESKKVDLSNAENQLVILNAEIEAFGTTVTNIETLQVELKTLQNQSETIQKNLDVYTALQDAFSPKGIPLLVVDNVVKELEIAINSNLKLLADLPMSISINTQHESRSGDLVDTFEIVLNDGLDVKPYMNYSGGEKLLIDLAIRLGLSELLAKRNNFKVETLIIDEGLGSLDETNQLNFFNTLAKLESKFRHILVITHTQVKDCFKQRIELVKENGITTVDKQAIFRV